MKAELVHGVVVQCPEIFRRKDFAEFVNAYTNNAQDRKRLATWHTSGEMTENSDVFMNLDGGQLSEENEMPEEVAELLRELVCNTLPNDRSDDNKAAIVWLQNTRPNWPEKTRTKLATKISKLLFEVTETFEAQDIGADLAYLMSAILNDTVCEWPKDRLIIQLLENHTEATDPVWDFIQIEEA